MAVPPPDSLPTLADLKRHLRMTLRTMRRGFVMAGGAPAIDLPMLLRSRIVPGTVVTAYLPDRFEADPLPMAEHAADLGARLALPRITGRGEPMMFHGWVSGAPLEAGPLGIRQPHADAPVLSPDIILAPLVGFDDRLNRLGQGGGYYDGAFARYPDALRVGIAWSVQRVDAIPVEAWDQPLHAVVTEIGLMGTP